MDDKTSLEFAILENVQRSDLNAIEEATAYQRLMDEFTYTQEELAKTLGKSRSHVANTLRLTNLPTPIQDMVIGNRISAGHARALLSVAEGALRGVRVVVAAGQLEGPFRRRRHQRGEGHGSGLPRRQADPGAEREDGVEHRAGPAV